MKILPFSHVYPDACVEDIGIAAAQGIKYIINNRPDGEVEDRLLSGELEAAAQRIRWFTSTYRSRQESSVKKMWSSLDPHWRPCRGQYWRFAEPAHAARSAAGLQ